MTMPRTGPQPHPAMSAVNVTDTVGHVVAQRPALSRVFEQAGIDYCCGGKQTVAQACHDKGLDPTALLGRLNAAAPPAGDEPVVDPAAMSLAQLADHIEQTHHAYLRADEQMQGQFSESSSRRRAPRRLGSRYAEPRKCSKPYRIWSAREILSQYLRSIWSVD